MESPDADPADPADTAARDAEAIAAALGRLRGPRMPRPPGPGDAHVHGDPHLHGDAHVHGDPHLHGGPPWMRGGPHHGRHGGGESGWPDGPPPWAAGARMRFGGPARLRLLDVLAAASAPLSVSELAERVGVDQPRASRLVQQAVALGLARREADPDDARRTRILLTDRGSAIVRGIRGDRRDAVESALAAFTDAERSELARLLAKLAEAWPRD